MDSYNINFTEIITTVINEIFSNFFISIDSNIYSVLDDITFVDSSILSDNKIIKILGSSSTNSIILICLSILFRIYFILLL